MSSERYWDYDTELLPLCKALMEMSIYERPITPLTVLGETGLARSVNAVYCKINRIVNSMYKAAWHSDTNGTSRANDCRKALIEAGFDLDGLPELIDTRKIRGRQKKHSTRSKQSKGSPNGHVDFSAAFAVVPTITDLVLQTRARPILEETVVAMPQLEQLLQNIDAIAYCICGRKRPKISTRFAFRPTVKHEPWIVRVIGQVDIGVGLIVT